jgi:hypothetical protein
MTYRCPYCDQSLLEDETVCWQCGNPIQREAAEKQPAVRESWRRDERRLSLSALTVYAVFSALVIVSALGATVYLGGQPRLQAGADAELPENWLWVNESDNDFLLFLPESWRVSDPESEGGEARLTMSVVGDPEWREAMQPFGQLDEQLTYSFMARGPVPPEAAASAEAVVLVARSRLLNQLAPAEMVALAEDLAAESGMTLVESNLVAAVPGIEAEHVSLVVESDPAGGDVPVRCQQQLIPGSLYVLLVSACTRAEPRYQTTIGLIMDSFQRIAP